MLSKKLTVSACAAAMLLAANVRPALAQEPIDSRTEFTFNSPVELPGVTLPPGTYVFRFADPNTSRKVMQVQAKDASNKTYGLFLTISAQRPRPSDEAELRFLETSAGKPTAVKTWWYPGNTIGREFIYPKEQARRLAAATNTNVLTTKAENVPAAEMATTDLTYVEPGGQETSVNEGLVNSAANTTPNANAGTNGQNSAAMTNTGATAASTASNNSRMQDTVGTSGTSSSRSGQMDRTNSSSSGANQSASNQNASNGSSSRRRLPRTNTILPLIALMGLMSLAGGVSVRAFAARR